MKARKNKKMSTLTAKSDLDKYFEDEKNRIEENYTSGVSSLDKSKRASSEMAAVTRDRLLKYIPEQLDSQGIKTRGLSEDATIKAFNNYQNVMAGISQNYDSNVAALDKERHDNLSKLESEVLTRKDNASDKHFNAYNSIMTGAKNGVYDVDDVNALVNAYGGFSDEEVKALVGAAVDTHVDSIIDSSNADGRISAENSSDLINYLETYKEAMGDDVYQKHVDSEGKLTVESAKLSDQEYAQLITKYNVNANGSVFDTKTATADEILSTLDVYEGEEQTEHIERLLAESKTWGADKNGTVQTFNYGYQAGKSKGNYFVFYNGKWYQTNYTQGEWVRKVVGEFLVKRLRVR